MLDGREISALWEELSDQAIEVFNRAFLPGTAWFTKVHGNTKMGLNLFETSELNALICGKR